VVYNLNLFKVATCNQATLTRDRRALKADPLIVAGWMVVASQAANLSPLYKRISMNRLMKSLRLTDCKLKALDL
jgi:hypothetical protein